MSFSIKWLFGIVALAAIFAAALVYRDMLWSSVIVTVTLGWLLAATIGVVLGTSDKSIWVSFCIVGWVYVIIAFTSSGFVRLVEYLPSTVISDVVATFAYERPIHLFDAREHLDFGHLVDIIHCLLALICASAAGVIASYCVRRSSKVGEH